MMYNKNTSTNIYFTNSMTTKRCTIPLLPPSQSKIMHLDLSIWAKANGFGQFYTSRESKSSLLNKQAVERCFGRSVEI